MNNDERRMDLRNEPDTSSTAISGEDKVFWMYMMIRKLVAEAIARGRANDGFAIPITDESCITPIGTAISKAATIRSLTSS